MTWYADAIRAKWNDEAVREAIIEMIDLLEDHEESEHLIPIEKAVWGPRVECPHDCGSELLVGAPSCWGCELAVKWEGRTPVKGEEK